MSNPINDGGPAVDNMTLRDCFAAKALTLGGEFFHNYGNGCDTAEHIAGAAYQIADAMIAERAPKGDLITDIKNPFVQAIVSPAVRSMRAHNVRKLIIEDRGDTVTFEMDPSAPGGETEAELKGGAR